jgi:hypothetical protein
MQGWIAIVAGFDKHSWRHHVNKIIKSRFLAAALGFLRSHGEAWHRRMRRCCHLMADAQLAVYQSSASNLSMAAEGSMRSYFSGTEKHSSELTCTSLPDAAAAI